MIVARGQVIDGKYQLTELIAEGAQGDLWRAELRGAGGFARPVAVKVIRDELVDDKIDFARFLARVRLSAELEHPNVVHVHDLTRDRAGHYLLVTDWVDGLSLRELSRGITRLGLKMPWPVACAIAVGVLRGLAAAHDHVDGEGDPDPVFHGQLTPDRILIGANGIARIAGFGLLGPSRRRRGSPAEVLVYQAPEVALGAAWGAPADVFAVGALLWQALTGAPPFANLDRAVGFHAGEIALPSIARQRSGLPAAMVSAINRALAFSADDRFPNADDMAAMLTPLLGNVRWRRGPQADLGRSVIEARAALGRSPHSEANDLFAVCSADIIEVVDLARDDEPILLTELAEMTLSDDDLMPFDDDDEAEEPYASIEIVRRAEPPPRPRFVRG